MAMTGEEYRKLVHLCFAEKIKPEELRAKGGVVGGRSNVRPQMRNGAGARGPKTGDCADEGARSRQPH